MTGAEHYDQAEHLLTAALQADRADTPWLLAEAQVHATLAVAAALSFQAIGGVVSHPAPAPRRDPEEEV